jgi:hypothetical protein
MTTLHEQLNQIGHEMLSRRVRAAEAVAWQALNIHPLDGETAEQVLARIRFSAERNHPELLIRFEHNRQEILPRADDCGCDPDSDGYDDDHCESDQGGEFMLIVLEVLKGLKHVLCIFIPIKHVAENYHE